jgi:hypothetical protein
MALKGTSGGGKSKASRPSRPSGGSSPKFSGSSEGAKSSSSWSSGKSGDPTKSFSGKPAKPFSGGSGGNRTLWLILGALVLLALCCICSLFIAWTYGDSAMELLRQMQFQ